MKDNKSKKQSTADLIKLIKGENLELLDFDHVAEKLQESDSLKKNVDVLKNEFEILRSDYIGRITSMLKAIGAVKKSKEELEEVVDFIETLPDKKSEELCKLYRKVQSKFRDNFPASFGQVEFIK